MNWFSAEEILETKRMIENEDLDIRTITLGISLLDCAGTSVEKINERIRTKIVTHASQLTQVAKAIKEDYGIPIINKRIAITPISIIIGGLPSINQMNLSDIHDLNNSAHSPIYSESNPNESEEVFISNKIIPQEAIEDLVQIAKNLDNIAKELQIDFIGGFSALVSKGFTRSELCTLYALPRVLSETERVCASVNVGSTIAGVNMNAVRMMGHIIKDIAFRSREHNSIGCGKLVVFANAVDDNPFMAGAYHGVGESECCINVGVSGPGVVRSAVSHLQGADFETLSENIKKTAFKITRMGQLVAQEAAKRMNIPFGIVDLSLAPTPEPYDSVAGILEEMGLSSVGGPGTTAALALLTDAIKKGGMMASSYVGGLSGAFIPVSEDYEMNQAAIRKDLSIEKLEAMTAVCSVGLDMVCIPGNTSAATISGLIADECMIGVMNSKTTGSRLIPVFGKKEGDFVDFGGLLGQSVVMPIRSIACDAFINRKGRIPAPLHSKRN